MMLKVHT